MYRTFRMFFVLCFILLFAAQASANISKYAVAPFTVSGPNGFAYLQKAIPSMLSSRLYWQGHFEPVFDVSKISAVKGKDDAKRALAQSNADYMVWGNVAIKASDATITIHVNGKDGQSWKRIAQTKVTDLIASLQGIADAINNELFGRPVVSSQSSPVASVKNVAQPMNPHMIQNTPDASAVYLNPQIRYQGQEGARLRTQHLPFTTVSMEVGDFDGDGKNEIALLTKEALHIYRWGNNLELLAEYPLPKTQIALIVRQFDLNRDGVPELIISSVGIDTSMTTDTSTMSMLFTEPDRPYSYILSFKGGVFKPIAERLRFYMTVATLPPDYTPVLVGQKGDLNIVYDRTGVREVVRNGNEFSLGHKVKLPRSANLFSFTWLPTKGQRMLVNMTTKENIHLFSGTDFNNEIYSGSEVFGGSQSVIEAPNSLPGFKKDYDLSPVNYPVPGRMLVTDLDKNGEYELIVNKPISVAAQYFSSFRDYPEGEIHALTWDGVGLSLLWKTRRIKGTVADFALTDINNDGTPDLAVCVNTYTGALGVAKSKTTIIAYPLDLSQANPATAPARETN